MAYTLKVRQSPSHAWTTNFSANGWKVRDSSNGNWIQMTTSNTKIRNADNTAWVTVK